MQIETATALMTRHWSPVQPLRSQSVVLDRGDPVFSLADKTGHDRVIRSLYGKYWHGCHSMSIQYSKGSHVKQREDLKHETKTTQQKQQSKCVCCFCWAYARRLVYVMMCLVLSGPSRVPGYARVPLGSWCFPDQISVRVASGSTLFCASHVVSGLMMYRAGGGPEHEPQSHVQPFMT